MKLVLVALCLVVVVRGQKPTVSVNSRVNLCRVWWEFQTMEEKVHNLQENLMRRPVVKMNGDKFRNYVRSAPRNYSMIIMMTALTPGRGCSICK